MMSRENTLDRILYSYFLEQIFSVATGRLDKIFSVLIIILGSSVIFDFAPFASGIGVVIASAIQTTYEFGKKSGSARQKSTDYLQLFDAASNYGDDELRRQLQALERTDLHIWSSLKDIAILKTQIKIGIPPEQREKLPLRIRLMRVLCG